MAVEYRTVDDFVVSKYNAVLSEIRTISSYAQKYDTRGAKIIVSTLKYFKEYIENLKMTSNEWQAYDIGNATKYVLDFINKSAYMSIHGATALKSEEENSRKIIEALRKIIDDHFKNNPEYGPPIHIVYE